MPNVTKALFLIAALLTVHAAQAADATTSIAPAVSGSARPDPGAALDGAQLFATHCAMCHKAAELARRVQSAADPETARADVAAFLTRHGRSDTTADGTIIDYLTSSSFR